MAIDGWLLQQRQATLRLYRWQRPCLSLGRHQHRLKGSWIALAQQGHLELVRRPSGGQAVLHGGDLTYALVWPDAPGNRQLAYRLACQWLQHAFASLGQPLHFGQQPAGLTSSSCFASSTAADLVHQNGMKRIGSAQLWQGGCLMQHGSIQLEPNPALWSELFGQSPAPLQPLGVSEQKLEDALLASAEVHLPMAGGLKRQPLVDQEFAQIASLLSTYRVAVSPGDEDGSGMTSPDATMPRTT
jgi:lipoate---protein ligase